MSDADVIREGLSAWNETPDQKRYVAALDALVAERDEWSCPFCLFVPEDGRDELESHLQSCSGMSHWRAEAAEARVTELEAALRVIADPYGHPDQTSSAVARAALDATKAETP